MHSACSWPTRRWPAFFPLEASIGHFRRFRFGVDTTFHGGLEQVLLCNLVNFVLGGLQLAGVILLCSVAAAIPDSM